MTQPAAPTYEQQVREQFRRLGLAWPTDSKPYEFTQMPGEPDIQFANRLTDNPAFQSLTQGRTVNSAGGWTPPNGGFGPPQQQQDQTDVAAKTWTPPNGGFGVQQQPDYKDVAGGLPPPTVDGGPIWTPPNGGFGPPQQQPDQTDVAATSTGSLLYPSWAPQGGKYDPTTGAVSFSGPSLAGGGGARPGDFGVNPAGDQPDSAPGQMANVTTGGNTGGSTGIYTGAPTTNTVNTATGTSSPASMTGASTPQGSDMIKAIATAMGRPYDEIAQLVNPALIAGGYSANQIAQTPVVQGLQNPDGPGFGGVYRTAPVGDSKFGTIQAFGIPLGIRGGQDINAQSFNNTTQASRDMVQGAVESTGQNWPDVQQQMLRSSPATSLSTGAFGRRMF